MMNRWCILFLGCAALATQAAAPEKLDLAGEPCSGTWNQAVESIVATGDGSGHGPDLGSDEWKSVVEFKLGLRGNPTVPPLADEAWCGYIDRLIRARSTSGANTPAFDCSKVGAGSSEAVVCRHPGQRMFLSSSLDRSANDCSNVQ